MCGIVGILSTTKKNVGVYIYDALAIIQHRGQDAAGITTASKGRFYMRKGNGMVRNVFRTKIPPLNKPKTAPRKLFFNPSTLRAFINTSRA